MIKLEYLNDYTLLEKEENTLIRFYPIQAMNNTTIDDPKKMHVLFEIEAGEQEHEYKMYAHLVNPKKERLYSSYSISLKEVGKYKYVILDNINDFADAEILPDLIIDFNELDYESFLNILANNKDLSKMAPILKDLLEQNIEDISEEKEIIKVIDIPSPLQYFQNITGTAVSNIEHLIANEEEQELTKTILKNLKKSYELVLNDESQSLLAYLSLKASVLRRIKSNNLKSKDILETAELKLDTNSNSLEYSELNDILNSYIKSLKDKKPLPEELTLIQDRITYIISLKPRLKKLTNSIKVILCNEEYRDNSKRVLAIKEEALKDLIIASLANCTYRPLPRNQVLLYHIKENTTIDFVCVISTDKISEILNTFRINKSEENKKLLDIYDVIENLINNRDKINDINYLKTLIYILLSMYVYCYKNIDNDLLLFNKGDYILKLDYLKGKYDISVINRDTDKKIARLTHLTKETEEAIKAALNKGEKQFNILVNNIIYKNLESAYLNYNYDIEVRNKNHKDTKITINKSQPKDIFVGNFSLEAFLLTLSNIKQMRDNPNKKEEKQLEPPILIDENDKILTVEEQEFILRKSDTIYKIMMNSPIKNENYKKVVKLYQEYKKTKKNEIDKKQDIIIKLKELL